MLEAASGYGSNCCSFPEVDTETVPGVEHCWCYSTAAKPHAGTGQGLLYLPLPLNKPTLSFPNPAGCQPQSPLSPPWDMTGGSSHSEPKVLLPEQWAALSKTRSSITSPCWKLWQRGRAKRTQQHSCCLLAGMCFLIPSPNLALSMLQPNDAIRETLS